MFKKIMLLPLLSLLVFLAACGPTVYADQANLDSQRTYQQQYTSYNSCYSAFPFPGDCYRGVTGLWYSPFYYPWGAVIHHNHTVSYNHVVPVGGVWVRNTYPVRVDYSYSRSYVSSRTNYYRTQASYRNSSASSYRPNTTTTTSYRSPSVNRPTSAPTTRSSSINFGSRTTYTPPTRSSSPSRSSYSSGSSYRSSGSSYRSSSSSSSYRSSGRGR